MIKNIIFDLGGVLVKLDRSICINSFRKIGYDDFGKILNDFVQEDFFLDFERGVISDAEFRNIIRGEIGHAVKDSDIDKAIGDFLTEVSPEKLRVLGKLREKFRLFLLSNTNPVAMKTVRSLFRKSGGELEEYFDEIFLSYELKLVKPDLKIFEEALKRGNMRPEETIFVDDSQINLLSANELGIKTLLVTYTSDLEKEISRVV